MYTAMVVIIHVEPAECQDGVTNICPQMCERNVSGNQTIYICSCEDGLIFKDGECQGNQLILCTLSTVVHVRIKFLVLYVCIKSVCDSIDVDECTSMYPFDCPKFSTCRNSHGSYSCECNHGFMVNKAQNQCKGKNCDYTQISVNCMLLVCDVDMLFSTRYR